MLNKEDILDLAWEHSEGSGERYTFTEESLFEFLKELKKDQAPAQIEQHPVGTEGVVPVVCYLRAFQDGVPHWTEDCVCEDAVYPNHDGDKTYSMPMVRQSDHIAALSALTAERDRLREALIFACKALCKVTSSDGSGHADIALSVLRLAGVGADEREAMVEGWKANVKWRADAAMAAKEGNKI